MLKSKLLLANLLLCLFVSYCGSAQQRIFDVHLHGAKEPRTQLTNLTKADVYKIAISTSWDLQQQYHTEAQVPQAGVKWPVSR